MIGVTVPAVEKLVGVELPKGVYLGVVACCVLLAMFQAWREEHERAIRTEALATTPAWGVLVRVLWVGGPTEVGLHLVNRSKTERVSLTFAGILEFQDRTKETWRQEDSGQFYLPEYVSLGPMEHAVGELHFYAPLRGADPPKLIANIETATLMISEHVAGKTLSLNLTKEAVGDHVWR